MSDMTTVEAKAFVPARDFALSKQFYQDLGFVLAWSSDELAFLRPGTSPFLLRNRYTETHAEKWMRHLLVREGVAWWRRVQARGVWARDGVRAGPPAGRPRRRAG